MAKICIFLINLYRKIYISSHTKPRCRFSPTCSSYAVESYQKFGFLGTYLTVKRLLKCHPFYKGEYFDNVPLFKEDIFKFGRKNKNKALYLS